MSAATQPDLSLIRVSPLSNASHGMSPVTNRVTGNDGPNWASEDYNSTIESKRKIGALERIRTSDLCLRRAIGIIACSFISKRRLIMHNSSITHG